MQIGIDHGSDERTALSVQASRRGKNDRAAALQAALRDMGYNPSIDFCRHTVETGLPFILEELPKLDKKEPS